jgi:16S rRNA C967 or C1407 C5-methylase (RsmB/RsmF family)
MFERYAAIIPDFEGFEEALRRPRDLTIRVNTLRIDPAQFERHMRAWGHDLRPLRWCPEAFFAPDLAKTRATLEYFLGLYYIQGATSMVPPIALAPQPGDRVLDLCAAPGSKTTQVCAAMKNEGLVVANDIFIDRLKILKGHLERLGCTSAVMTRKAGDAFPGGLLFDRVLVDAPCSGEGTMRGLRPAAAGAAREERRPGQEDRGLDGEAEAVLKSREGGDMTKLHRLQRALLRRAANLCVPGGVIVYSTCTYSPLENEAVVDEVLRARDDLELEEVPCDAPSEPGVVEFEGQKFKPWLRKCRRYYPHRLNSWGFFVARLRRKETAAGAIAEARRARKRAAAAGEATAAAPAAAPEDPAHERVARFFTERYGLPPETFAPYRIVDAGPSAWLASRAMPSPAALRPWDPQNAGIRLLRYLKGQTGTYEKPTSHGLAVIGRGATRNAADLTEPEVWTFLRGEPVTRRFPGIQSGYAVVRYEGYVLGCGLQTAAGLVSQIPASSGVEVRSSLFLAPAGPAGVDWSKLEGPG